MPPTDPPATEDLAPSAPPSQASLCIVSPPASYDALQALDHEVHVCIQVTAKLYEKCKSFPLYTDGANDLLSNVESRVEWLQSCLTVLSTLPSSCQDVSYQMLQRSMQNLLITVIDDFTDGVRRLRDPLGFMPDNCQAVIETTGRKC